MAENFENKELLDKIIVGRVEPHIYAFSTNAIPNYLKVGDTCRPVNVRLKEWKTHYPDLQKEYSIEAKVNSDIYFRDYSVHDYLEKDMAKQKLDESDIGAGIYYSQEFFKETTKKDIKKAVEDIKENYDKKTGKYKYYHVKNNSSEDSDDKDLGTLALRDNQKEVVKKFIAAKDNGQTHLLMYAVMRFGKTFTSLMCAKKMNAKLVLIVSGKADVGREWEKTCKCYGNFKEEYTFCNSKILETNYHLIKDCLAQNQKLIIFLTLQDLQGKKIKEKHKEIFENLIDLLIVDETHFAARAPVYGYVLKRKRSVIKYENVKGLTDYNKEENTIGEVSEQVKELQARITLHLSGTPYRILMGSEFKEKDIICHCQFSDIVDAQREWDAKNPEEEEWKNPYYGFPQMIRFAFHPSKRAKERLDEYKERGGLYAFSALLEPESKINDKEKLHRKFINEKEVLELFQVIDGSEEDENVLGFLDYDKIKKGGMCRHIVCVLPYCASCDALEELIYTNKEKFKNLNDYKILNISSVEKKKGYKNVKDIQSAIHECENKGQKTLTLTVNRMLTGTTVEEWDTMIYLKDTSSPQEYDQAIFRLQNQYIRDISADDDSGEVIKRNMKPQTLLVDFDPQRVFTLQEQKAQIESSIENKGEDFDTTEKIQKEIEISPIITINKNRIEQVTANNIIEVVRRYSRDRGVLEETLDIPVDLNLMDDCRIAETISMQAEIGSSGGLKVDNVDDEGGSDFELPEGNPTAFREGRDVWDNGDESTKSGDSVSTKEEIKTFENKFRTYYARILFYSFLVEDTVKSFEKLISTMSREENITLAQHLNIDRDFLQILYEQMNKFIRAQLDYKINNINSLAHDDQLDSLTRVNNAMLSFNRLSDSEVVTPQNICREMVGFLPEDDLIDVCKNRGKILDIAGKIGEFATALYERLTDKDGLNQDYDTVKDLIYTIPTSKIAYEFTKKIYKILGLNVNNIATFTSYDFLSFKDEKTWQQLQDKTFSEIDVEKNAFFKEGEKMKFDFIIGNPPYQDEYVGENNQAKPIYNLFMENAYEVGEVVELITPARFLNQAGATPKKWNEKMLNSNKVKILYYAENSSDVFSGVEIKGGVVVTYYDENANYEPIKVFIKDETLKDVFNKVEKYLNHNVGELVHSPDSYKFTDIMFEENPELVGRTDNTHAKALASSVFDRYPEIFIEKQKSKEYVKVVGRKDGERKILYTKGSYLNNPGNLYTWKVLVAGAIGSGTFGEPLSEPVVLGPASAHTQSFVSLGEFETEYEAKALYKYLKTKFLRAMLGIMKTTQNNQAKVVWSKIPLQDFTPASDIDWSKTIPEIDQQLYAKYDLDNDEIAFIESRVKEME